MVLNKEYKNPGNPPDMSSKVHKNEMTSSKRIQNREDNMELKGCLSELNNIVKER